MLFNCPYCRIIIEITEYNCKIIRCGIYKRDFQQIPPHLNEEECNKLVDNNLIYGCSKPSRINDNDKLEICDYI